MGSSSSKGKTNKKNKLSESPKSEAENVLVKDSKSKESTPPLPPENEDEDATPPQQPPETSCEKENNSSEVTQMNKTPPNISSENSHQNLEELVEANRIKEAKQKDLTSKVVGTGAVVIAQIFMKMTLEEFKRMFWTSGNFYRDFVQFSLGDEDIEVSSWKPKNDVIAGQKLRTITRVINSKHPLAFSFPGLDSRVSASKSQVLASIDDDRMIIVETASFTGMPYADHFVVVTRWVVLSRTDPDGSPVLEIQIVCEVIFRKWTILQKRMTSDTISELTKTYMQWGQLAESFLLQNRNAMEHGMVIELSPELVADAEALEEAMSNNEDQKKRAFIRRMTVHSVSLDDKDEVSGSLDTVKNDEEEEEGAEEEKKDSEDKDAMDHSPMNKRETPQNNTVHVSKNKGLKKQQQQPKQDIQKKKKQDSFGYISDLAQDFTDSVDSMTIAIAGNAPKDQASRRMLGGAISGAVVGTIVTLNPIGLVVGAMIGAGAGAGVHEFSKEINLGEHRDETLVSLSENPFFALDKVKENQGVVPIANHAIQQKRRMSLKRQSSDDDTTSTAAANENNAHDVSTSQGLSDKVVDVGESGDIDDSDILLLSLLASRGTQHNNAQKEAADGQALVLHPTAKETDNVGDGSFSSYFGSMPNVFEFSPLGSTSNMAMQQPTFSPLIGRYFTIHSSHPSKAIPGSIIRDDGGKKRWAIWTREAFKVIRFAYESEQEARADFNKWVYVRILTDENNVEVDARNGWHPAPQHPLADMRAALSLNA